MVQSLGYLRDSINQKRVTERDFFLNRPGVEFLLFLSYPDFGVFLQ